MKKLFAAALLLTAGFSMSAHAGFISGPKTFDGGKSVDLQGLEWMPLTYTAGLSRNQVEAAGGFTDRFGGVWNAGVWRYATRNETETLLGSLWGGRFNGWSHDNFAGAAIFLQWYGALYKDNNLSGSQFIFGAAGECYPAETRTCYGDVASITEVEGNWTAYDVVTRKSVISASDGDGAGYFNEYFGADMNYHGSNSSVLSQASSPRMGSLLVRSVNAPVATVSSPAAISLFALGLCGLLLRRRKIAA